MFSYQSKKYRSYRGAQGRIVGDRLKRVFTAQKPNQKWVTDITEFKVGGRKLYFSPVMDLYNGEIISYQMSESPLPSLVKKMLSKAAIRLKDHEHPILHSDQGWHYQMPRWQRWLKEHGIMQSMSRKDNCLDNAAMESFFSILKSECFYLKKYQMLSVLKRDLIEFIHYYNYDRIKEKLNGLSPVHYRLGEAT